jgi:pimeloyl-ACP methyl ester carboxylesterase
LSSVSRRGLTIAGGAIGLAATLPAAAARVKKPPASTPAPAAQALPQFVTEPRVASLDDGTQLYYETASIGAPVIFVHGSLSDYSYWQGQLGPFAQRYRVLTYSRRYNWPNQNPARKGYSAVVDAEDLARFIANLDLAPAHIVGHSYGAFAALFLAARHPQLVRTLTLAEPPVMSLLAHVPGAAGAAMLKDVRAHMIGPMKAAFGKHDTPGAVRAFIDYVTGKPGTWDGLPDGAKAATLKNAHEWEVMFAGGELFPELKPAEVAGITAPVLMLSGAKSYPFMGLIGQALAATLPGAQQVVFPDASHQMWLEEPVACREAVFKLIDTHG